MGGAASGRNHITDTSVGEQVITTLVVIQDG
jgi:hypothetical protein